MPIVVIAPLRWSRSPLQTFLLILCTITGLVIVLGESDNRIIHDMGEPWASLWGLALMLGSAVTLTGSFWRNRINGMLIERSGIVLLGLASFVWPILVLLEVGLAGAWTAFATIAFSVTCLFQVRYINKHFKMIIDAMEHPEKRDG